MANVVRLPFARGEYVRQRIEGGVCHWCGAHAAPRRPMYEVRWEPDASPNREKFSGSYCSWECYKNFFNIDF